MKNIIHNFLHNIIPWNNSSKKIYKIWSKANKHINNNNNLMAYYCRYKITKKYKCDISPYCKLKENINFPHPIGIVIGGIKESQTVIGKNCTIYQNVTIGQNNNKYPIIGDNVTIYAGAIIFGNIKIGNNVVIGANSVVNCSIPDNCVVAGVPAKIINHNKEAD